MQKQQQNSVVLSVLISTVHRFVFPQASRYSSDRFQTKTLSTLHIYIYIQKLQNKHKTSIK